MYKNFEIDDFKLTKYLFFTGKGGVGKTSTACAIAVALADSGKNIMLVSTDPASNLQDVFDTDLDNKGKKIREVQNLTVANFEPELAAAQYKESVIGPYRGKLPDVVLENMEEQLSGSCTVEIAAFNEFSSFITDKNAEEEYDHIIFDTAPTGHTLRMLQLPSAWSNFISESTHGASCLGQLAGLEDKKDMYKKAVENLADGEKTRLILISRPDKSSLLEAERASMELQDIGVKNQLLIINGILQSHDDELSNRIYNKQQEALRGKPKGLETLETFEIPLKPYNISGISSLRSFFKNSNIDFVDDELERKETFNLEKVVEDLYNSNKKVIFTMGKGGVGKTTIAATVAMELAKRGKKVHLTTTDPANHLKFVIEEEYGITISNIDEKKELLKYQQEVLEKAKETMDEDDIAYIEEDLRSPCTQEIVVFRAFADIVQRSNDEVVVIDTAPTGHTLLLLESTESYNNEISRTQGEIPKSVKELLPKLKDSSLTEVLIVTLPEATPYYEAKRLEEDLKRAEIYSKWWIINSSFYATATSNEVLKAKASNEIKWINKIAHLSKGNTALIKWSLEDLKGENLSELLR